VSRRLPVRGSSGQGWRTADGDWLVRTGRAKPGRRIEERRRGSERRNDETGVSGAGWRTDRSRGRSRTSTLSRCPRLTGQSSGGELRQRTDGRAAISAVERGGNAVRLNAGADDGERSDEGRDPLEEAHALRSIPPAAYREPCRRERS
jgi:hypothetical protein